MIFCRQSQHNITIADADFNNLVLKMVKRFCELSIPISKEAKNHQV